MSFMCTFRYASLDVPFDVPLEYTVRRASFGVPFATHLLVCLSYVSFILPSLVPGNTISNTKGYPCQSRRDKATGYR